MQKYIILSLVLHVVLLITALHRASQQQQDTAQGKFEQPQDIVPKQVAVDFVQPQDLTEGDIVELPKPKPSGGLTECQNDAWFGGIGIYQSMLGRVENVIEGYPAHKAGILVGDDIVSTYGQEIRGEPGTIVTIIVKRESTQERLTFTLTRDRICTGDKI